MSFVSVVVCTKDRPDDLKLFLVSLLTQKPPARELIVVDASADQRRIKDLCESLSQGKNIVFKYIHTRPGLTYQRNVGISLLAADSEYICFFDDDVVLFEDTIQNMMLAFQKHGEAGAVQGVDINAKEQNPIIRIFKRIFFMGHASNKWELLASGENAIVLKPSTDISVGSLMTGYCLKRVIADKFRFDEWFTGYSFLEDYDFSFRVAGSFKMVQSPSVRFIHNSKGSSRMGALKMSKMKIVNKYYFFKKNTEKTPVTVFAFYWSLVGHAVFNLVKSITRWESGYIVGTLQGIATILKGG